MQTKGAAPVPRPRRQGDAGSSSTGTASDALAAARPVGARRSRRLLSLRDTARAMSQENVEIVRRVFDALEPGRHRAVLRSDATPRSSCSTSRGGSGPGAFCAAATRCVPAMERDRQTWDSGTTSARADRVHRRGRQGARRSSGSAVAARASGVEVEARRLDRVDVPRRQARRVRRTSETTGGSPRSRGAVGARRSRRLLSLRDTARAMSQENVEIVRRAIEAFNARRLGRRS